MDYCHGDTLVGPFLHQTSKTRQEWTSPHMYQAGMYHPGFPVCLANRCVDFGSSPEFFLVGKADRGRYRRNGQRPHSLGIWMSDSLCKSLHHSTKKTITNPESEEQGGMLLRTQGSLCFPFGGFKHHIVSAHFKMFLRRTPWNNRSLQHLCMA